ncbi:sigma-70 family RNA polymerase sigma factor [Sandaracinobacteroides saxicola]|nr:FliA/WhiG family RNA polymerase sigma factor [Sandaracinobacteroides saxicola]
MDLALYGPKRLAVVEPERLVRNHMGLVRKIAWHVHGRVSTAIEVEELVQIGMIALIESARNFEDRGHAAFATYATVRIRGAMVDALRKQATLNRGAMRKRRALVAARESLMARLGRAPGEAELAAEMGLGVDALRAVESATVAPQGASLDEVYSDSSMHFASDDPDAFAMLADGAMRRDLAAAIAELPEREAMVLQLYFVEEMNLEEIGAVLDVGAARVCQIKKAALDKVRRTLAAWA